ncbi:hypothetical protein D3C76_1154230 [compost metagenome]
MALLPIRYQNDRRSQVSIVLCKARFYRLGSVNDWLASVHGTTHREFTSPSKKEHIDPIHSRSFDLSRGDRQSKRKFCSPYERRIYREILWSDFLAAYYLLNYQRNDFSVYHLFSASLKHYTADQKTGCSCAQRGAGANGIYFIGCFS